MKIAIENAPNTFRNQLLMVIAGAAGEDPGTLGYNGTILGLRLSAYHFG